MEIGWRWEREERRWESEGTRGEREEVGGAEEMDQCVGGSGRAGRGGGGGVWERGGRLEVVQKCAARSRRLRELWSCSWRSKLAHLSNLMLW